jgi:hypothetical protein
MRAPRLGGAHSFHELSFEGLVSQDPRSWSGSGTLTNPTIKFLEI